MLGAAGGELVALWMNKEFLKGTRWFEKAKAEADLSANPALSLAIDLALTRLFLLVASSCPRRNGRSRQLVRLGMNLCWRERSITVARLLSNTIDSMKLSRF
jgi:hypothetical protein